MSSDLLHQLLDWYKNKAHTAATVSSFLELGPDHWGGGQHNTGGALVLNAQRGWWSPVSASPSAAGASGKPSYPEGKDTND